MRALSTETNNTDNGTSCATWKYVEKQNELLFT